MFGQNREEVWCVLNLISWRCLFLPSFSHFHPFFGSWYCISYISYRGNTFIVFWQLIPGDSFSHVFFFKLQQLLGFYENWTLLAQSGLLLPQMGRRHPHSRWDNERICVYIHAYRALNRGGGVSHWSHTILVRGHWHFHMFLMLQFSWNGHGQGIWTVITVHWV